MCIALIVSLYMQMATTVLVERSEGVMVTEESKEVVAARGVPLFTLEDDDDGGGSGSPPCPPPTSASGTKMFTPGLMPTILLAPDGRCLLPGTNASSA